MTRPARRIVPPSRYINDDELEPTPHHRVVTTATSLSTASTSTPAGPAESTSSPSPVSSPPPQTDTEDSLTARPSQTRSSSKRPSHAIQASASLDSVIVISPTTSDDASTVPKTKKPKTSLTSGDRKDSQLTIIDIDDIEDPQDERLNKTKPTADINYFFTAVARLPGDTKGRMSCDDCA